jgi:hypothetical protein
MNSTDLFLASRTNEDGSPKYPNYANYLPQINAAIAEQDRVSEARTKAGWDADPEYGWGGPNPITGESMTESEYIDAGFILPEDAEVPSVDSDAWRIYKALSFESAELIQKYLETKELDTLTRANELGRVATGIIWGLI